MKKSNKYLNRFVLASTVMLLPTLGSLSVASASLAEQCGFNPASIAANSKRIPLPGGDIKPSLLALSGETQLIPEPPELGEFKSLATTKFSLNDSQTRMAFLKQVDDLLALSEAQGDEKLAKKTAKNLAKAARVDYVESESQLKGPEIGGDVLAGLRELRAHLADFERLESDSGMNGQAREACQNILKMQIYEISNAINNNYSDPIVSQINIVDHFLTGWLSHLNRPGDRPGQVASNVSSYGANKDLSLVDPPPSPLWAAPSGGIRNQNTYLGFGRTESSQMINVSNEDVKYEAPKEGFGTRPGIKVERKNGEILKVRILVEANTGPFLSRLGHALGYSTYSVDYAKELKMIFDLKFFTEYNSRSDFGATVLLPKKDKDPESKILSDFTQFKEDRQPIWNPFDVILEAQLKDGSRISREDLVARLFKKSNLPDMNDASLSKSGDYSKEFRDLIADKGNYDRDFAKSIKTFTIGPVSLEVINKKKEKSIGAWGWNTLGHADLRESRGFTLLAAWLGLHDVRKENTRLMIVTDDAGNDRLELRVSDWGSGLGVAQGHLLGFKNERPNEMAEEIVKIVGGKALITTFKPNQPSYASDRMTIDDARWMARKIAEITPKQIDEALRVTGYSEEHKQIYKFKLIARRNQIMQGLGLGDQIAALPNISRESLPKIAATGMVEKGESENPLFGLLTPDDYKRMFAKAFLATPEDQIKEIRMIFGMLKVPMNEKDINNQSFPEEVRVQYAGLFALFAQAAKASPVEWKKVIELYKSQSPTHRRIILTRLPKVLAEIPKALAAKIIARFSSGL